MAQVKPPMKFKVHNVEPVTTPRSQISQQDIEKCWSQFGNVQACSQLDKDAQPVGCFNKPNLLAEIVYDSFYEHRPLKLNPNIIWLTIAQGFGRYVDLHAEELRSKFVQFEGKKTLLVKRRVTGSGTQGIDWPSVFPEFAEQIGSFIGKETQQLVECNFSNTSPVDRICSHITLMDVCKNYFTYRMLGEGCGIPWIELLGTVDDWKLIREKTAQLRSFGLASDKHLVEWINQVLLALDHFVSAAEGHPDLFYWGSVCNLSGMSGIKGSPLTGWIQVFFPYLIGEDENKPNKNWGISQWYRAYEQAKRLGVEGALKESQQDGGRGYPYGIELREFPSGLSKAPVEYENLETGEKMNLTFYGGIVATYQHSDGALEARSGWAVVEQKEASRPKEAKRPKGFFDFDEDF
ncbi:MAG: hypothetical protein EZS28_011799 [Streblomastix strix]|uniref:Uncharacterized protein n=1 Tax=Streblomastix strix TaxID=222440 RepID=A0A5J4WDT3_9EUKA|nr:MAG: hypothetical protein EZS28_011799 [Streblomastix strix]